MPRATDIPYQTFFLDFNYTSLLYSDMDVTVTDQSNWAQEWDSGYAAATEGTNMSSQYISVDGYVLNGTSRKIRQHVQRTFG
jgi:hypothetical protein